MATYGTAFCSFEFLFFIYLFFFFFFFKKKTSDYHACTDICYLFILTIIAGVSKSLQRGVTRVIGVCQWNVTMSIGIGITIAHKGTGKGAVFFDCCVFPSSLAPLLKLAWNVCCNLSV